MQFNKHRYITILLKCCFILFVSCTNNNFKKWPLGSKTQTDSIFKITDPYFEYNKVLQGLVLMDSIYKKIKNPTGFDYIRLLKKHAYINGIGITKEYNEEIKYADSGIHFILQQGFEKEMIQDLLSLYNYKAFAYFGQKNYAKATDVLFEARKFVKETNTACAAQETPYYLGMFLYKQQAFEEAIKYFKECVIYNSFCITNDWNTKYANQELLDNIGLCYTKIKQYDSADVYYAKDIAFVEKYKDSLATDQSTNYMRYTSSKGVIYGNWAKVPAAQNNIDSAIALYKQAIYYHKLSGIEYEDAQYCKVQLAELYYRKQQWKLMFATLQDVNSLLHKVYKADVEFEYNRLMYLYYQAQKNNAGELKYYQQYITYRDSLSGEDKKLFKTNIDKELKDKDQQLQIQLLQKNNQLNKIYLWVTIGLIVMALAILFLVYVNYKRSKKNVRQLLILNSEISEQKLQLEFAKTQLEQSNTDKDRILNVVAHDLRNPISGVAAIVPTILEEENADEQKSIITLAENTLNHALKLINQLLQSNTASKLLLNKQIFDIHELIRSSLYLLKLKAEEKQLVIEMELPEHPSPVNFDKEKIERVLHNLINNAVKFSQPNNKIIIQLLQHSDNIVITVKDFGIGIPEQEQEKIFERLTTLRRKGTSGEESFGMGLSICKEIVEAHEGKIWVESIEGKGSTFYVQLPYKKI